MFETAKKKLNLIKTLFENIDKLVLEINMRDKSKDLIIYYNTEDQLFKEGEDSKGNHLGDYSDYSIAIKKEKGQPFDHITLRDTNTFYDSFEVTPKLNEIAITANTIKTDENGDISDLTDRFGNDIIGINAENLQLYREYVQNALLQLLRKEINAISGLD